MRYVFDAGSMPTSPTLLPKRDPRFKEADRHKVRASREDHGTPRLSPPRDLHFDDETERTCTRPAGKRLL